MRLPCVAGSCPSLPVTVRRRCCSDKTLFTGILRFSCLLPPPSGGAPSAIDRVRPGEWLLEMLDGRLVMATPSNWADRWCIQWTGDLRTLLGKNMDGLKKASVRTWWRSS
ncbi:unnamed protein product [Victoria cruziana]